MLFWEGIRGRKKLGGIFEELKSCIKSKTLQNDQYDHSLT